MGFLPEEARHGFLIDVPKGSAASEMICITEHRGNDLDHLGARAVDAPQPNDPALRVVIDRARWLALAPAFGTKPTAACGPTACRSLSSKRTQANPSLHPHWVKSSASCAGR